MEIKFGYCYVHNYGKIDPIFLSSAMNIPPTLSLHLLLLQI